MNSNFSSGRHVPKGEKRGPRTKQVALYFSEEEVDILDRWAKEFGYRSKASMLTDMLSGPISENFTGWSFFKLGNAVANLKGKLNKLDLKVSTLWAKLELNPEEVDNEEFKK